MCSSAMPAGGTIAIVSSTGRSARSGSVSSSPSALSLFSALAVNLWSGFTLSRRGDLTGAEPLIRQAAGEMRVWGVLGPVGLSYAWGMLAEVLVGRGDLPGAQAVLADAPATGGPSEGENHLRRARVKYPLAAGDTDGALAAAEDHA